MQQITQILNGLSDADGDSAERLLPLVYEELRRLAVQKLAHETPGQTLQATALVHEAYLRLVGDAGVDAAHWNGRGHFFAAAAEAMRRILVEVARRKKRLKHGGEFARVEHELEELAIESPCEEIEAVDAALTRLAVEDAAAARIVELHFFAGLSMEKCAEILGISRATAFRQWAYARAWLRCEVGGDELGENPENP